MDVVILTRHSALGATARLRAYNLQSVYEKVGPTSFHPFFSDRYVRSIGRSGLRARAIRFMDTVRAYICRGWLLITLLRRRKVPFTLIIQQESVPALPAWCELVWNRLSGAALIVYDVDDAHHEVYRYARSRFARKLLGGKIPACWRSAELILAGSPMLVDDIEALVGSTTVVVYIPTVLEPSRYRVGASESGIATRCRLGWIGTPSNLANLESIMPDVEIVARNYDIELVAVGAGDGLRSRPGLVCIDWTLDGEVDQVASFDIGIMPLEDTPFTRGKCGYKLLQYMAAGIPVIASDVGVNRYIVGEGASACGDCVPPGSSWVESITALTMDPEKRRRQGAIGRQRVITNFSVQSVEPLIVEALNGALMRRGAT